MAPAVHTTAAVATRPASHPRDALCSTCSPPGEDVGQEGRLGRRAFTLAFGCGTEEQFMTEVALERWPLLVAVFCFDLAVDSFRLLTRVVSRERPALTVVAASLTPQLNNMALLYGTIHWDHSRARRCTVLRKMCGLNVGSMVRACSARST